MSNLLDMNLCCNQLGFDISFSHRVEGNTKTLALSKDLFELESLSMVLDFETQCMLTNDGTGHDIDLHGISVQSSSRARKLALQEDFIHRFIATL